eukprot:1181859-Prorocentrum_minimum.AAC.2
MSSHMKSSVNCVRGSRSHQITPPPETLESAPRGSRPAPRPWNQLLGVPDPPPKTLESAMAAPHSPPVLKRPARPGRFLQGLTHKCGCCGNRSCVWLLSAIRREEAA